MSVEVRRIEPGEVRDLLAVFATAFGEQLTDERAERWSPVVDVDRARVAVDGGELIGCASAFSLELTLPGDAAVPTAGLTLVGVLPTHRRRGTLRRLLAAHFDEARERGEAASGLLASEGALYGRFGYGVATQSTRVVVDTDRAAFADGLTTAPDAPSPAGSIELIDHEEAAAVLPGLFEQVRTRRAGEVSRPPRVWREFWAGLDDEVDDPDHGWFFALHRGADGEADGAAVWRVPELSWDRGKVPAGTARVAELVATSPAVRLALWRFLLDLDLVTEVEGLEMPLDDPLRWALADPRACRTRDVFDHLWLRPLDTAALLEARTYAGAGRLVVEVLGPDGEPAERLAVVVDDGEASCEPTGEAAGLTVPASSVGALVLGAAPVPTLAATGRLAGTDDALALAEELFAIRRLPYCSTFF